MKSSSLVISVIALVAVLLTLVALYDEPDFTAQAPAPSKSLPAGESDSESMEAFAPQAPQAPQPRLASRTPPAAGARPPQAKKLPTALAFGPIRITGKVEDREGQPLQSVQLRWIPIDYQKAWLFSHDAVLLNGDASRLPAGRHRQAFALSRTTQSGPAGRYRFEFDRPQRPHGVVAATAKGYQVSMKPVWIRFGEGPVNLSDQNLESVVDFRLGLAGIISGVVRDRSSSDGVQGMAVAAHMGQPGMPPLNWEISLMRPAALTDSQGRYSIQGLAPGYYWVAPQTGFSDYVSIHFEDGKSAVLEADSEIAELDFEVDRGGRIKGRFVDSDGRPVAEAQCNAIPSDLASRFMGGERGIQQRIRHGEQQTPQDGSFDFRGLSLGRSYRIHGKAYGLAKAVSDAVKLQDSSPQADLEIVMQQGSAISGSVVREDGKPVSGSRVAARLENDNPLEIALLDQQLHAETDEQGHFELKNLVAGRYRVMAQEGMGWLAIFASQPNQEDAARWMTVELDGLSDVSGITLVLDDVHESSISGVVVDDLGKPIESAFLHASSSSSGFFGSANSGSDGAFEIQTRAKGPYQLTAEANHHSRAVLSKIEAGRQSLRIVLNRIGSVSGRILTPDGSALPAGARVEARRHRPRNSVRTSGSGHSASPSRKGVFLVAAPAGEVEVVARVPGFAIAESSPVTVQPGAETGNIEIHLIEGAVLRGQVVHQDGWPLEGAQVKALLDEDGLATQLHRSFLYRRVVSPLLATTGIDGKFELTQLRPGSYSVSARHPGHVPSDWLRVDLADGQSREIMIEVATGSALSGRVLKAGLPQPGMTVLIARGYASIGSTASDEQGRFMIDGLAEGEYGLHVMDTFDPHRSVLKSTQVSVEEGQARQVDIELDSGRRIFGGIQAAQGGANFQILVRLPSGPSLEALPPIDFAQSAMLSKGSAMTSGQGEYEIRAIDPGHYLLEVYRLPENRIDYSAYQSLDRSPLFQQELQVGERDVRVDIVIR